VSGSTATSYAPGTLTAARTYYWQVAATNTAGTTSSAVWSFTTASSGTASAPPSPWVSGDIGSVGLAGSASYSNGTYNVVGSGSDIWGTADSFQFLYRPLTGLTEIVARLTSQQAPNSMAKAGVMMREGNAGMVPGGAHVMLSVRQNGTVELVRRASLGSTTEVVATTTQGAPVWLKLKRSSSTITASVSTNGSTWRTVGTTTLALTSKSQFGLAVTSHDTASRDTATFDNVSVR
jgi:regulation of enolase protein 1 (concanavalin A-like superfamily)